MLCDSNKVKDPMKVGRFGLGFKSVFHMTGRYNARNNSRFVQWNPDTTILDITMSPV